MSLIAASPPVAFTDLATPFGESAAQTAGQPMAARISLIRRKLDSILPGVYPASGAIDRRLARALAEFSETQASYDRVVREFPRSFEMAVTRVRRFFPDFVSPLPVYLYHSLGTRDGGSAFIKPAHRLVMLFGADMIAKLHADDSLQPFMEHELFHLEHARHFRDCQQFWCAMWQEGLAVSAAAAMTPHATDHQLLLDTPVGIRALTEARLKEALCHVSAHFDDTNGTIFANALMMSSSPPFGLPPRFGYYVGYKIAAATGQSIDVLDRLDNRKARPIVRRALVRLMAEAGASCVLPAIDAKISYPAELPA